MMTRSQIKMVVAYLSWKPWTKGHALGWKAVHVRGLRVLAMLAPFLAVISCGSPFTATSASPLVEEEPEASAITPSADGRVSEEAAAPTVDAAAPERDVLADPWPADVVVVEVSDPPPPCINCVPTFAGPMACCQGSDPNRTCNGHPGATYCEGCGCP